ncbi:hypothetical protein [Streptomyces flavalbus]|uniref:HEAT repeat domain-containing protein n=1 Tax=Streptomyces flavalbus TaxID=2665155 RepID=A0ABW2W7D4_9ACTN
MNGLFEVGVCGVREDIRGGGEAALRVARGVSLRDALDVTDPAAWTGLDLAVRSWWWPGELPRLAEVGALDEGRLALALCHPDGRVREAALIPAAKRPALSPLVVVRCADWVAPVRERAREVLRASLDADAAVALAPLVLRVGRRERGSHAVGLLGEVLRGLPRERRTALFDAAERSVRRYAYRLAVEDGLLSPAELARTAARDEDVVVQNLCAESALAAVREGGAYDDDVLPSLLGARAPRVRAAGVTALRAAGRPEAAVPFLVDRAAMVRACARYVVRQYGGDPRVRYRAWCADPADPALPPGAAVGLAECGERADAVLLWPLLAHPVGGVRAGAVAGLRVLDVADVRRLLPLLDDPVPGVVREAARALLPGAGALPVAELTARLAPERPASVRRAAFRLLRARGDGVVLRAAAGLVNDPDERLRVWAGQVVRWWGPGRR